MKGFNKKACLSSSIPPVLELSLVSERLPEVLPNLIIYPNISTSEETKNEPKAPKQIFNFNKVRTISPCEICNLQLL